MTAIAHLLRLALTFHGAPYATVDQAEDGIATVCPWSPADTEDRDCIEVPASWLPSGAGESATVNLRAWRVVPMLDGSAKLRERLGASDDGRDIKL